MCETQAEYKPGDIVWVKLAGICWWPGETADYEQLDEAVKDDLKASLRQKSPIAIVKFFQEDSYEYVNKHDKIFPYNCSKKDDFIRKGMDMHRAKRSQMQNFPDDVVIAEKKLGGDENILDDPKFTRQKVDTSVFKMFGTPEVKPSPKPVGRQKGSSSKPPRFVTHPRFTGKLNDHQRIILIQTKKEDSKPITFKCSFCSFTGRRIDAIALHTRTHLKNDPLYNDVRKKNKKRGPKKKLPPSVNKSIEKDSVFMDKGTTLSGGEISDMEHHTEKKSRKRKRPQGATKEEDTPHKSKEQSKKAAPDITNDLLAEWDDGDDDDDESTDFELNASSKSIDSLEVLDHSHTALKAEKLLKPKEAGNGSKANADKLDMDFTALLETTKVPDIANLTLIADDVKIAKIEAKPPEVATKLTNPKKRFVKSFEDFELSMKQQLEKSEKEILKDESEIRMEDDEPLAKMEDKKSTENKTIERDEPDVKKLEDVENSKKKSNRRISMQGESHLGMSDDDDSHKTMPKIASKVEQKKSRRASTKIEKTFLNDGGVTRNLEEIDEHKESENVEDKEGKKPRRGSTTMDAVGKPERTETRKSCRKTEGKDFASPKENIDIAIDDNKDRKQASQKEDKECKATRSETDNSEKQETAASTKKPKSEVSIAKGKIDVDQDKDKKKENKICKIDEKLPKKDAKTSVSDESKTTEQKEFVNKVEKSEKPSEKAEHLSKLDKTDKSEAKQKLVDKTDKSKPKPKPLFEIDVFGSLRAQENEKYNKKSDESPRRETRASRTKSHSTLADEPKPKGIKRPRSSKSGSIDEAQINNGKNDDTSASPLISKMKNKLMNKLAVELDSPIKKAVGALVEKANPDEDKGVKEKKSEEVEVSDEDKKKMPASPKKIAKRVDMNTGKDNLGNFKAELPKSLKDGNTDEEKSTLKNEVELSSISKPNTRPSSGPKTYTRSSRIEKIEKVEKQLSVKSLASATKAEVGAAENSSISVESESKSTQRIEVDQHIIDGNTSNSTDDHFLDDTAQLEDIIGVCMAKSADKTCLKPSSPVKKMAEALPETNLLKATPIECIKSSDSEAKGALIEENFSIEQPKKPPPSPPAVQELPAKETASAPASFKVTKSFLKSPVSPQKTPLSPSKTPTPGPSSPVKTTPRSPKKSPVASSVKQPSSPIKQPKTSPIILNRDAAKFDPSSSPKRAFKLQSNEESVSTTLNIGYESKVSIAKSPRKISLSTEEVSITEGMQVASKNNDEYTADAISVTASTVDVSNTDNLSEEVEEYELEKASSQHGAQTSDPLDLLAAVSTLNKDVTVVPENILADGQVELAKIIEDGTEKMTSFPKVVADKDTADKTKDEQLAADASKDVHNSPAELNQMPIILNSRLAAASSSTSDQESTSKLLDILTDNKRSTRTLAASANVQQVSLPKIATPKFEIEPKKQPMQASPTKQAGRILASPAASTKSKPTILSDTLIKPADAVVSVQKVKRTYDDVEDIDTFIITKHAKTTLKTDEQEKKPAVVVQPTVKSKPKILEHTIITASGQVLQPIAKVKKPTIQQQTIKMPSSSSKTVEEKVYDLLNSPKGKEDDTFDIDSMPIVLGDQLLTNDNIEAVVSEVTTQKVLPLTQKTTTPQQPIKKIIKQIKPFIKQMVPVTKTYTKVIKGDKVYQTASTSTTSTVVKHQPTILASGKQGKFVIVPSQSTAPPGTKYTVGKRQFVKKQPAILAQKKPAPAQASSSTVHEPSGGKIMIVTDDQGQQKRVLVSTTDQRRIRYQTPIKKGIVKASPQTLSKDRNLGGITPGSGLIAVRKPKLEPGKVVAATTTQGAPKKFLFQGSLPPMKGPPGQTRTVIIKNQQGEIVNRIHGTSDEDIEKQVAEQLEAINRASKKQPGGTTKRVVKKTISAMGGTAIAAVADTTRGALQHKAVHLPSAATTGVSRSVIPPLSPLTPARKPDIPQSPHGKQAIKQKPSPSQVQRVQTNSGIKAEARVTDKKEERSPKQLVIQDAMGNETTIMEGQILALPSETVDGQPQSYMLVTLDENGTLTPLNNEALMSLDPNLNLGGDLSNMVLQIEGSGGANTTDTATTTEANKKKLTQRQHELLKGCQSMIGEKQTIITDNVTKANIPEQTSELALVPELAESTSQIQQENQLHQQDLIADLAGLQSDTDAPTEQIQAITCNINKGDSQQNLIITGDPVATQKFLESLTEGNPEITNLLAHVEGQNILIHTDGQQIFINSDVDNQMLMSLNQQEDLAEESAALHASQASSSKNQDILAAALADTDVFQQEQTVAAGKLSQTQLSPGYPLAANNVLETSTVNSPIMTPLEAPKIGCTKIKECEVLNQLVPKNVDLPITITDPNIAQSVSTINPINHQVLMPSAHLSSIEIALPMPDVQDVQAASTTSAGISGPGLYSLPVLVDGGESPISMPLLTGEPEEVNCTEINENLQENEKSCATTAVVSDAITKTTLDAKQYSSSSDTEATAEYLLSSGDMCMSSLSEPPPDMFDFPVDQAFQATSTQEEREPEDLLNKSPKRGLSTVAEGEKDGVEVRKRAKLD